MSVMARSPIPKKPPVMDLTLTLVSELSIHVKNQLAGLTIDIQSDSVLKLGKTCGASRTKVLLQLLRFSQISSTSQKYATESIKWVFFGSLIELLIFCIDDLPLKT